jgi:hypothetical protein
MNVLGRVGHAELASSCLRTERVGGESLIQDGLHAPLDEFTGVITTRYYLLWAFLVELVPQSIA